MDNFYLDLPPFTQFMDFTRAELYRPAPADWLVAITDVRGFTEAIRAGQYKWVNMAGATTIAALANVLGSCEFPFVWAPLLSSRGTMLSLLVRPRGQGEQALLTLRRLLAEIARQVGLETADAHPIKPLRLRAERIWRTARAEARLLGQRPYWPAVGKIAAEMLLVRVLRRLKRKWLGLDIPGYIDSLPAHSDFRKFDGTLRMVIDCTPAMQQTVRALLERERAAGNLYFGMHASPSALMTCFLQRLEHGGHIHFVDGNDGGYAMAAIELKAQMAG